MHVELVTAAAAQAGNAQRLPHGRRLLEFTPLSTIGDGEVIDGLHMRRFAEVLNSGDEALGARVEQMPRLWLVILLTPGHRLGVLFLGEARCLAEAYEPWKRGSICVRALRSADLCRADGLTRGIPIAHNAGEDTVELSPVPQPVPAHHGHTHGPEAPAEEGHQPQLDLGEVAAATKHARAYGERLNHVEVGPRDMVGHDDRRLTRGQFIAGVADISAIEAHEDELDPCPDDGSDAGRGVVDQARAKQAQRQNGREGDVGDEEGQEPGQRQRDAAEVGEACRPRRHGSHDREQPTDEKADNGTARPQDGLQAPMSIWIPWVIV